MSRALGDAPVLRTERLLMRAWREDDLEPFRVLNGDPVVMEHFVAPLTAEQSDAFVLESIVPGFAAWGYGLWAVEVRGGPSFIGFVGLANPSFDAWFTPCTEIGWRLDRPYWGHGYATEAAREAIAYGFGCAGLEEIVSFTSPLNTRSLAVMERLGMTPGGEFDHPRVPAGHPLRRHLLYRLRSG